MIFYFEVTKLAFKTFFCTRRSHNHIYNELYNNQSNLKNKLLTCDSF